MCGVPEHHERWEVCPTCNAVVSVNGSARDLCRCPFSLNFDQPEPVEVVPIAALDALRAERDALREAIQPIEGPSSIEVMSDPHRAAWFELCNSLTSEQTAVLVRHIEREHRRVAEPLRAERDAVLVKLKATETERDRYKEALEEYAQEPYSCGTARAALAVPVPDPKEDA